MSTHNIKHLAAVFVATVGVLLLLSTSVAWAVTPTPDGGGGAGVAAGCSKPKLFGVLVPWYEYLQISNTTPSGAGDVTGLCRVVFPSNSGAANENGGVLGAHSAFFLIILAVIEDLVRVAALVAVGYVIYGGIQYMTSGGSPDGTKKAQTTIINSLVGLVLAIVATSIVSLIGHKLMGN